MSRRAQPVGTALDLAAVGLLVQLVALLVRALTCTTATHQAVSSAGGC
jgi:hypothetical protein